MKLLLVQPETSRHAAASAGGVDVHLHATMQGQGDMIFTPERALVAARSVGLERILAVGNGYYRSTTDEECRTENDFLLETARKDPTHIAAAIAVSVNADWALRELRRMHVAGARIVKLHAPASQLDLRTADGAARFNDLLSEAEALDMTALIHGNFPGPDHACEGGRPILVGRAARRAHGLGTRGGTEIATESSCKGRRSAQARIPTRYHLDVPLEVGTGRFRRAECRLRDGELRGRGRV